MEKAEIISEIEIVHSQLWTLVETISNDVQTLRKNDKWSPVENIEHINKSITPLVRYLGTSKTTIEEKFGLNLKEPFEIKDLNKIYLEVIQNGVIISDIFKPSDETSNFMNEKTIGIKLLSEIKSLLEEWTEIELDKYVCPHPVLGQLKVREMLYFTIFHCQTHISIISNNYK